MKYLFHDPRPEIIQDTNLWNRLLRLNPKHPDTKVAYELQTLLWTLRSSGTMLKFDGTGLKFVPIIGEGNYWESEAEFEDMKRRYLGPYAKEIAGLLRRVMQRAN